MSQTNLQGPSPHAEPGESPLRDLEAVVRSRTPLIAMESGEEPLIVNLARQICRRQQLKGYRWTITEGLVALSAEDQPTVSVTTSIEVLQFIHDSATRSIFLLLDFHPHLKDPIHVRHLKDIVLTAAERMITVIVAGLNLKMPDELQSFTVNFDLPLPTAEEVRGIVIDVAGEWGARHGQREVQTTNKAIDLLVRNLIGLSTMDVRRLVYKAINENGMISESDIPGLMKTKYELLGRDGVLTFEGDTASFAEVGGMRRLCKWLEVRKHYFLENDTGLLDPPRGILLLGVQGCGKSLMAKAAAGIFRVPLLRLDFGVLYNKYYGETERNLRKALSMAEAMAPCVLWLDEIEKGLGAQSDDDGLSRRILGTFLTWLAERKRAVFTVATANDIQILPPELVRKGRFDEIFFADLPQPATRESIFRIHFHKRSLDAGAFDLPALVAATEGFSGSEMEQAIVSAMYNAHAQGEKLAQQGLLAEIHATRPLSVVMAEKVEALRQWAIPRTVPCD